MLRSLLFWSLFPLVLPQALYVRSRAPRFAAADGATEGSVGSGAPLKLLAVGDSIIAGVGAARLEQALVGQTAAALADKLGRRVDWSAFGESGIRSDGLLNELLGRLPVDAADVVLVSIGVNDVTGLRSLRRWRRNLRELIGWLSTYSPEAVLCFAGLPPMGTFPLLPQPLRALIGLRAKSFDATAARIVAESPRTVYVPVAFSARAELFSGDGYHPSEAGYRDFAEAVACAILPRLADPASAGVHSDFRSR